jgi:hypothetical protein
MLQFRLADRLHQPLSVIRAMTVVEFHHWLAYFQILSEEAKG